MAKHTAIYVRVSTRKQTDESQLPDLERWASSQDRPVQWYRDTASGKSMDRPGWNALAEQIAAGKVAELVVWRLDRLGRTASGLTTLFDELRIKKVNLVSLKEGIDLSTNAGRLMANVLASVAAFETEVRGERVAAGLAAAKAAGKRLGRPKGINKALKVTDHHRELVKRLKGEGKKIAVIARTLALSRSTVYELLADG